MSVFADFPLVTVRSGGLRFLRSGQVSLVKPYPRGISSEDLAALIEHDEEKIRELELGLEHYQESLATLRSERQRRKGRRP